MILMVPVDAAFYPTLGPQVCDFMEQNLVFGPGDLRGQPLILDDDRRGLIYRMYEVYPKGHRLAGRRRFQRVGISLAKGLAKTELSALIAACELHPEAPVRCTGFTGTGEPIGGPVTDPYIPFIAYSEEQSDELAYGALRVILENSPLKDDFDVGLERILRKRGDGVAVSLSTNPHARDGARTTFSVMDETHRLTLPRHRQTHQTMLNNLPKRKMAEPWMLEITTAAEPGTGSVAEATMDYAKFVAEGRVADPALFFFHRQASDHHDLTTDEGARAAVIEASGPASAWRDIDGIVAKLQDPTVDRRYWERVWCNRYVKGGSQAFDVLQWRELAEKRDRPAAGTLITVGLDGAQFRDSTAVVATDVVTGWQWVAGLWERPTNLPADVEWQVPTDDVDACVRELFDRYKVWRMYADPPYWQSWIASWRGDFGEDRVIEWWTNRRKPMTAALEAFQTCVREGTIRHEGDARMERHVGNARRKDLPIRDEDGHPLWLIEKDRQDSPNKIDAVMAAVLSWEARMDAIASGAATVREPEYQVLVFGGKKKP